MFNCKRNGDDCHTLTVTHLNVKLNAEIRLKRIHKFCIKVFRTLKIMYKGDTLIIRNQGYINDKVPVIQVCNSKRRPVPVAARSKA
jgi:hypothetical protein